MKWRNTQVISGKIPDPKEDNEKISCAIKPTEINCMSAEDRGAGEENGGRMCPETALSLLHTGWGCVVLPCTRRRGRGGVRV